MAEALADRLAEAFAEKLHELVRRELWGYAPDENISVDDMLKVKYQVRPQADGDPGKTWWDMWAFRVLHCRLGRPLLLTRPQLCSVECT